MRVLRMGREGAPRALTDGKDLHVSCDAGCGERAWCGRLGRQGRGRRVEG